jgi:hypothetical protein
MTTPIDLIRARVDIAHVIAARASKYLDIVGTALKGANMGRFELVTRDIAAIDTLSGQILAYNTLASFDDMCAMYTILANLEASFTSIIDLFGDDTYTKMAVYNMSSTYSTNVYSLRGDVVSARDQYREISARDDDIIIGDFLTSSHMADAGTALTFVVDHEEVVNKFMNQLIGWVVANTSGERRRRAELIIEKQKDAALGVTRVNLGQYPGVQGVIYRYNLRPASKSMPPDNLVALLQSRAAEKAGASDAIAAFERLASGGPGVIMINKSTPSPVEFDLSGIIDLEYITSRDIVTSPLSGVTKKVLERFDTARMLARGPPSEPLRRIAGSDTEHWFVVESINGIDWRVLSNNGTVGPIPATSIIGLLTGVSTRPHRYADIQAGIIARKCFDPTAQLHLAAYADMQAAPASPEPIQALIVDKLVAAFDPTHIRNDDDFHDHADMPDAISATLLEVLTHSTGTRGKGSSEYAVTYIANFEGTVRAFAKQMTRQLSAMEIPNRVFGEHRGKELEHILTERFREAATAAAAEMGAAWIDYDMTLKEFFLEHKQVTV